MSVSKSPREIELSNHNLNYLNILNGFNNYENLDTIILNDQM